jgi:hypothetical protein
MLLKNVSYIFCVLSICLLFFVISGIQYWVTDYFTTVIGVS